MHLVATGFFNLIMAITVGAWGVHPVTNGLFYLIDDLYIENTLQCATKFNAIAIWNMSIPIELSTIAV